MWFNRVTKDANGLLDLDFKDPHKQDDLKAFTFKTKAQAREDINVNHSNDLVQGKDGSFTVKHKTEVTAGCPAHDISGKFTVNAKENSIVLNHKLSKGEPHVAWKLRSNCQPAAGTWDVKVNFKHGGQQFGPITPWTQVS